MAPNSLSVLNRVQKTLSAIMPRGVFPNRSLQQLAFDRYADSILGGSVSNQHELKKV
jgi:hypothetical protein